jgi:hypothetical protein
MAISNGNDHRDAERDSEAIICFPDAPHQVVKIQTISAIQMSQNSKRI